MVNTSRDKQLKRKKAPERKDPVLRAVSAVFTRAPVPTSISYTRQIDLLGTSRVTHSRATMLALGCSRVEVVGTARRASLGRRRVAEDCLAQSRHYRLIGHDDQKIDDRHEDDEVDNSRDKRAEIKISAVAATAD